MTPQQKQEFLDQSRAHYAADMLLKGTYGDVEQGHFKGCSVGCHLKHIDPNFDGDNIEDKHSIVAEHYGYPAWLAHLQDAVFEGLPNGESARWHVQLAETIHALPDGYDWQAAMHRAHVAILRISYRTAGSAQDAVKAVIDLHERAARGEVIEDGEWSAAYSAADSAAYLAAYLAADLAADSAARSAADSAAYSAARSAAYQEIRDGVLSALSDHQSA